MRIHSVTLKPSVEFHYMDQKIVLITGATSGIGKETAKGLARLGAGILFTARDAQKGEDTKAEIITETKNSNVEYFVADLSSLAAVRKLAADIQSKYQKLDVLINNAGVLPQTREESLDGIELNLAVNFLAPFLLTNLLLPLLKNANGARVINVSSTVHNEGTIDFDDLESKKHFDRYQAYGQSKLALILWSKLAAKEFKDRGVTINCLHPGVIGTEMTMQYVRELNPIKAFLFSLTFVSEKKGAETAIYLASSPDVKDVTGQYFIKKRQVSSSPESYDMNVAKKLCDIARTYVGL